MPYTIYQWDNQTAIAVYCTCVQRSMHSNNEIVCSNAESVACVCGFDCNNNYTIAGTFRMVCFVTIERLCGRSRHTSEAQFTCISHHIKCHFHTQFWVLRKWNTANYMQFTIFSFIQPFVRLFVGWFEWRIGFSFCGWFHSFCHSAVQQHKTELEAEAKDTLNTNKNNNALYSLSQ